MPDLGLIRRPQQDHAEPGAADHIRGAGDLAVLLARGGDVALMIAVHDRYVTFVKIFALVQKGHWFSSSVAVQTATGMRPESTCTGTRNEIQHRQKAESLGRIPCGFPTRGRRCVNTVALRL
jgi:hypothetical protein